MAVSVEYIEIDGLHDRITYRIPISQNRLVLVGENGTGKSTVVNMLYYFITRQWRRLNAYAFRSVKVSINGDLLEISKGQLDRYCEERQNDRMARRLPSYARQQIEWLENQSPLISQSELDSQLRKIAEDASVPYGIVADYFLRRNETPLLSSEVGRASKRLHELMNERVLFLPTYRRIEQELNAIFRGTATADMKLIVERAQEFRRGPHHVELVAFGMEDVVANIGAKVLSVKENLRTELNALTGSYLRDVILNRHVNVSYQSIETLDDRTLDAIFKRLDEEILPAPEKKALREIVGRIHKEKEVLQTDRVVVHFLAKLYEVHRKQVEKERDIRAFVTVCNGYLTGKHLEYDDVGYSVRIFEDVQESKPEVGAVRPADRPLELAALSSGEKQIVSLFSHIYLSDPNAFFVIIDEPELSLSVPWQKKLLPDIIDTGKCAGLVAVTHSPFISDNTLDKFTRSIAEFREPGSVVR